VNASKALMLIEFRFRPATKGNTKWILHLCSSGIRTEKPPKRRQKDPILAMKENSMELAKSQSFLPLLPEKRDMVHNKEHIGASP
jgi:hypothetical protein